VPDVMRPVPYDDDLGDIARAASQQPHQEVPVSFESLGLTKRQADVLACCSRACPTS
jgi:hypothetical protein